MIFNFFLGQFLGQQMDYTFIFDAVWKLKLMKKVHWERPKLSLEVNFSVEEWAKTFVFDAILKLKTDEERSLGATIFFLEVNFSVEK